MSDFNLYSVNWQDGMLLSQRHLSEQETYFKELVRWYALDIGDRYGLVRKSFSGNPALNLNMGMSGNRLKVEVIRCQAITPGGQLVHLDGAAREIIRAETEVKEPVIPVYISVDPQRSHEIGSPDASENLPRLPYTIPSYEVHLGEKPNLPEANFIQVALLAIEGNQVGFARGYFPPCVTIFADERLAGAATDLRNRLENLLSLSTRAYAAMGSTLSGEGTSLQVAFRETIHEFVSHLAETIDSFITGPNADHPLQMVTFFKRFYRVISTQLNLHPGLKDYLNERFFTRESSQDVGQFLSKVDGFIMADYTHTDIGGHVKAIDEILGVLRALFGFLAQTKKEELGEQAVATETLTYSGKTYRNVAYSGCRMEQTGELCYLIADLAQPTAVKDMVALMTKNLYADLEWRSMQVRLGFNEARGLGETDPIDVDPTAFSNKVALHPRDMLESANVRNITLIFRGIPDPRKLGSLGQMDFIVYAV